MNASIAQANDASPTVIAAYCYAIKYEPKNEWTYIARWNRQIAIDGIPSVMGGSGSTIVFTPGQVTHDSISQSQGYEAKSVSLSAKVRADVLERFFVTPSTVRVKVFILRISTIKLLNGSTLNYDRDVQLCESGVIGQIGIKGLQVDSQLIPEPFAAQQNVPRYAFARSCQRVFGQCGVDLEALKTTATIYAIDRAQRVITASVAMPSANYWRYGNMVHDETGVRLYIEWAENTGTGGRARVRVSAWCKEFSEGDTITLYPGCALTTEACNAYGNLANYGGFPYVPEANPSIRGAA